MPETLGELLDRVERAASDPPVSVADVLASLGERSFAPVILVIAALMVSPLSGIPGMPTIAALLISTIGVQSLAGRDHPWLPQILLRRTVPAKRLRNAVEWLRRPAGWFDRHSHKRWPALMVRPMRGLSMLLCVAIVLTWPALEILPFFTSIGATAVALLSFGLLTRDGLYTFLGLAFIGVLAGTVIAVAWGA